MSELLIYIVLLAIWEVVLFFGHNYGISVLLFMVPLLVYLFKVLKEHNKIKNYRGLLLCIPIILLSMYYTIYNNATFNALNAIAIIGLLFALFIVTVKPSNNIKEIACDVGKLVYKPFTYIGEFFNEIKSKFKRKEKKDRNWKKILKTFAIIIPVIFVVLLLLSSADHIFSSLFNWVIELAAKIFTYDFINKLLGKTFMTIVMIFILGISTMYLIKGFGKDKYEHKSHKFKDIFTLKVLVTSLNVIYVIFDYIQIFNLFTNDMLTNINYANYARTGFFELLVVSIINMVIILLSKKFETNEDDYCYMTVMNILMIFLTLIIIASSFIRMHMYEVAYGFTVSRLFVDAILICESLLMIPTVMYIINDDFNISKSFAIIIISVYIVFSFINVDYLIARKNVNNYFNGSRLDTEYLMNFRTDNIPVLIKLFKETDDHELKNDLYDYFRIVYNFNNSDRWEEYNISKRRAIKMLEEIGLHE